MYTFFTRSLIAPLLITFFGVFTIACSTYSKVESSWGNEQYKDSTYKRVACLAAMRSIPDNASFEKKAKERLTERNIEVLPGYEILNPEDTTYSKEELHEILVNNKAEAVVIFKLIGVQEDKTYNPPTYYGPSYYGPHYYYYDYYYPAYRMNQTDGYWSETYYYIIETKIYDVRSSELIWTAKTKTADPKSFSDLANSVITSVLKAIDKAQK